MQPHGPGTQGFHPYAYANNDPTTLTDPGGHVAGYAAGTAEAVFTWSFDLSRSGKAAAGGLAAVAVASEMVAWGNPLTVTAARVLFMLAPAVAVVAALAIFAFLLVQTARWCLEHECGVVSVAAKAVVRWTLRAGEIAEVAVQAISDSAVTMADPCRPVGMGPHGEAIPRFGPEPEECKEEEEEEDPCDVDKARTTLEYIDTHNGSPPPFTKGGKTFANDGRDGGQVLPQTDSSGNLVTYKEYDVNPTVTGVDRGKARLVFGSDGSAYYTCDHYRTFTKLR